MLKQLAASLRPDEPAVGVPRRMPLVGVFLLVTIYCILVRFLSVVSCPTWLILSIGIFVGAVAAGQALLFDGNHPRTASFWVGGMVTPVLVVGQLISAAATSADFVAWLSSYWFPGLLAIIIGPWLGYLAGLFVASWFYLFAGSVHRNNINSSAEVAEAAGAAASAAPVPGRWMLRVRKLHPLFWNWRNPNPWVAAGMTGTVFLVPAWIISQFANAPSCPMICVIAFFSGAIASGANFWPKRASVIPIAAGLVGLELGRQVSWFGVVLNNHNFAMPVILATSGLAFLVSFFLLSAAGWLKYFTTRDRSKHRSWRLAGMLVVAIHIPLMWFAFTFINDFRSSPQELLARELAQTNGQLQYLPALTWPPAVDGFAAGKSRAAEHLAVFLQHCNRRGWTWISLKDSDFANEDGHLLDHLNVISLSLGGLKVDQRLFNNIESLRVKYYDLSSTNMGDEALACLAKVCNSGAINNVSLHECPVTAAGLTHLVRLTTLVYLDLSSCPQLGQDDWSTVPTNHGIRHLNIENAGITDEILVDIVRAFPNLTHLHLVQNNLLTDQGVDVLKQLSGLQFVSLPEGSISEQKAAEFERDGVSVSRY